MRASLARLTSLAGILLLLAGCASGPTASARPGATVYVVAANDLGPQQGYIQLTASAVQASDGHAYWSVTSQWAYHHDLAAPVLAGGAVIVVADDHAATPTNQQPLDGSVAALNPFDGATLWRDEIGAFAAQPVVSGTTIYLTALRYSTLTRKQKMIYAIRATDGHILWSAAITAGSAYNDQLVLDHGTLYLVSNDLCVAYFCNAAYLLAVNASTGATRWDDAIQGNLTLDAPEVIDGVVFTHTATTLAAFSAADGTALWDHDLWQTPVVSAGIPYIGGHLSGDPGNSASSNAVMQLDAQSGAPTWTAPTGLFPIVLAANSQAVFYEVKLASAVHPPYIDALQAVDAHTGAALWTASVDSPFAQAVVSGNTLFGSALTFNGTQDNSVLAVNTATGAVLWQTSLAEPSSELEYVNTILDLHQGTLYAAFRGNDLFAVRATDGKLLWKLAVAGSIAGLAIGG